jgi:hypothetical protein
VRVCSSRRNVSRDSSVRCRYQLELKRKDRPRLVPKIVKQHKIELEVEVEVEVKFIMVMKGKEKVGSGSLSCTRTVEVQFG